MELKTTELRTELRRYEEKYGLSSQEFIRLWNDAIRGRKKLPFPEEADLDLIEWKALHDIYTNLLRDIEGIRKSIKRLEES